MIRDRWQIFVNSHTREGSPSKANQLGFRVAMWGAGRGWTWLFTLGKYVYFMQPRVRADW